jgi:hypothetical protein
VGGMDLGLDGRSSLGSGTEVGGGLGRRRDGLGHEPEDLEVIDRRASTTSGASIVPDEVVEDIAWRREVTPPTTGVAARRAMEACRRAQRMGLGSRRRRRAATYAARGGDQDMWLGR